MIWALIIIPIAVGLGLGYTISRSMFHQKSQWINGLASISLILVTLPPLIGLFFLPQPWQDYGFSSLFFCGSMILWLSLLAWPRRKKRAGSLLWNLGWSNTHKLIFVVGLLWLLIALLQTYVFLHLANQQFSTSTHSRNYHLSQIIFYWSIVIYFIWAGLGRLELRENGLCFKFGLIRWQQIASYKWEGKKGTLLTIWIKQRFPLLPKGRWSIPSLHKPTIDRILARQLSHPARLSKPSR